MDFEHDAWSYIEDSTTLEEDYDNTTYTAAGDILR